jgi:phenylalanyl-tRNA synthetase beta chain
MIVTRKWLEEFIDLKNLSTEEISDGLNSIGQEVEAVKKIRIADKVVVGYVEECEKHPDADKLNICQVNVGNEVTQIVCGAKNVAKGQYVAVSVVGAILPGNFKIKKAKLRGVESFGMICSSTEIGLPKLEDGIMVLDNSIGELEIGKNVSEYLDDDIIELGVTANRGDSFSILGIARELSAKFNIPLKEISAYEDDKNAEGLGRILHIQGNPENSLHYLKVFNIDEYNIPFKIRYRLALVGENNVTNSIYDFATYTTVATGVITTIYDNYNTLIFKTEDGIDLVKSEDQIIYETGIKVIKKPDNKIGNFVIDANFIDPKYVSTIVHKTKIKTDEVFFRSSRGSNPDLKLAINYVCNELKLINAKIYNSSYDLNRCIDQQIISVKLSDIYSIIGEEIDKNTVVNILNKLQIKVEINSFDKTIRIKIPNFRHDLNNKYDIAEEILRIYGIDTLISKPLVFAEKNRINDTLKKIEFLKSIREKSVANGFFETLHFIFDSKERYKKYSIPVIKDSEDILNPIVNELDTLRQTTILQLLDALSLNKKNGYKKLSLFTIGSVYNELREESQKIGFVFSGAKYKENITRNKNENVDFAFFVEKLSSILGDFELVEDKAILLSHPYQSAKVLMNGVEIGFIAKLHPKIAKDFDLDDTFIAEFFVDLLPNKEYKAKDIVKIQKSTRDLSLVVDKNKNYNEIKEVIESLNIVEIVEFYPIDIFDLDTKNSLTLRFILQNSEKSMTDEEINGIISQIIEKLKDLGVELR